MSYNIYTMLKKFLSQGEANIKAALTGSLLFGVIVGLIDWRLDLGWFWALILLIPLVAIDLVNVAQKVKLNWQSEVYRGLVILGCFGLALDGGSVVAPSFALYFIGLTLYTMAVRTDGRLNFGKYFLWPLEALVSFFNVQAMSIPVISALIPKSKQLEVSPKTKSILRGVAFAAPILLVFGLLLASSDPIFARLFDLPFGLPTFDIGWLTEFIFTSLLFAGFALYFISVSVRQKRNELTVYDNIKFGLTESKILGWSMAALFGVFILVQFRYMFLGYASVIEGYTYSDYARRGFVELIVVSLMSLSIVRYFQTKLKQESAKLKLLNLVLFIEMLVLAASSLKRLSLYEQAYGLTIARLFAVVVVIWLVGVWVINAAQVTQFLKDRQIAGYAAAWLGVVALGYMLISPSSFVLKHNFARYRSTGKLDGCYQKVLAVDAASSYVTLQNEVKKSGLEMKDLDKKGNNVDPVSGNVYCSVYIDRTDTADELWYGSLSADEAFYRANNSNALEHTIRSYLATH